MSMSSYQNIPQLFAAQAEKYSDKTYIIFKDSEYSYQNIYQKSLTIAHYIQETVGGSQETSNIGILVPNSIEYIFCFFGIFASGNCVVSYNVMLKSGELEYQIAHSEIPILFTTSSFYQTLVPLRDHLPHLKKIVLIDELGKEEKPTPDIFSLEKIFARKGKVESSSFANIKADNAADMLYTSGTTGKPKGCMLSHANLLCNLQTFLAEIKLESTDTNLCILPLFHVNAQVVSVLATLYVGGSLVLEEMFKPKSFIKTVKKHQCKTFSAVPTVYNYLNTMKEHSSGEDLSFMKACFCGAAPMPVEVFRKFERNFKAKIIEGYGLSEGTCVASVNPVNGERKIGSIGLCLKDQEMQILDSKGKQAPSGEIGEIVIRGKNIFKGYFNNPEASKEAVRDGWLFSGDMGYQDQDGYFFITGRKKEMIIRGGENIFPKEIEESLYEHEAVLECAVIGLPDKKYGEKVVACICKKAGFSIIEKEFIKYLRSKIASYKIPDKVEFFQELPKTATGKIQKYKLRQEIIGDLQTVRSCKVDLTIPYRWALGKAASKYFTETKLNQTIYGSYADDEEIVGVIPKSFDPWSFSECTRWKKLSDEGTLHSFTEIHMEIPGQKFKPPYHIGLIQIDGSHILFFHIIKAQNEKDIKIGQKVKAVWEERSKRKGDLFDIQYFEVL